LHLNTTCADDIAKLSLQCIKIPLFNKTNQTKSYDVHVKRINDEGELEKRKFTVSNLAEYTKFLPFKFICKNDSREFAMSSCSAIFE
jgi:hypothetical protein